MATIPLDVPRTKRSGRAVRPPHPTRAPNANGSAARGPNWGRLVSEGRSARAAADGGRWRIGQLASLVAKQYGGRSLQAFADDIGESYSTVRRYRWVFTSYDPTIRFRFQQLSFSHFQAVAGRPDAKKWLERAEHGCWSVDELVRQSRARAVAGSSTRTNGTAAIADLRTPGSEARTHLRRFRSLDQRQNRKAASWLEPLLDDLEAEIGRIRSKLR